MCFFYFNHFLKERKSTSFNRMPYYLIEIRIVKIVSIKNALKVKKKI